MSAIAAPAPMVAAARTASLLEVILTALVADAGSPPTLKPSENCQAGPDMDSAHRHVGPRRDHDGFLSGPGESPLRRGLLRLLRCREDRTSVNIVQGCATPTTRAEGFDVVLRSTGGEVEAGTLDVDAFGGASGHRANRSARPQI